MVDPKLPDPTELIVGETAVTVKNDDGTSEDYDTIAKVTITMEKDLNIDETFFISCDESKANAKPSLLTYVVTEKDGTILEGEQAEAVMAFFHSQISIGDN